MIEGFFFKLAFILYFVSTVGFFIYFRSLKPEALKGARLVLLGGFFCHTLNIALRLKALKAPPVTSFHESSSFLAWAVVGVYFFFVYRGPKVYTLGTFLLPLVLFLMTVSALFPSEITPLPPVLRSLWLPIHAIISLLSYAFFLIAAVAGLMYLLQERQVKHKRLGGLFKRLPPLESLDRLNELCVNYGFPLLSLGIITGAIWAEKAWGTYWSWDPKETCSLILWFIYAALLHERLLIGWRGRKAAIMALIGFVVWMISYFVANLFLPGLHSHGKWS